MNSILLKSSFLPPPPKQNLRPKSPKRPWASPKITIRSSMRPDPWSLSDGNHLSKPKPRSKNPKNRLSDDNARRIIKGKAQYLSQLRKHQGPRAETPKWIRRTSLQKKSFHGRVIELWRHMVDKGVAPNSFTYTVVISPVVKEGLHEEAFKIFNEMKNIGHVPEEVTYSYLISICTENGNFCKALRLYEDMRSRRIVPSNFTCASLLTLFHKIEDYNKPLSLFTEMHSKKIAADEVIYGLLIRIYGKLGQYDDAQKTFEETQQLGLLSDEKTYLAMAQVYLNSGNPEKALNVIEMMKSQNIWLSRFAYIVLLQCYVMKEDLESAEATLEALSKTGLPDAGSCNDMLNLFVRLDLTEKAKDFICEIMKNQVAFDEDLFKTSMEVLRKRGMRRDAEQLIGYTCTNC